MAFSPDGKSLAAGAGGNSQGYYTSACKVTLWNVKSGDQLTSFTGNENGVADVAISPDGSIIASGGHDSTVRLWDIATGKSIATLRGHRHAVMSIAISPNGRFVASGSGDRTVRLWELASIKGKP